jgi:membrane fusion protein (multidrug efflux system)
MKQLRGLVVLATLAAACRSANGSNDDAASNLGNTRVPVSLGTITRDSLVDVRTLTGRLVPRPGGSALLTAPAAGVVRNVRVQVGDRLARGAPVAELEVPELAADAAQKASAAAQSEREAARQQQLVRDGITSARSAEEASASARQAAAAARAAQNLLSRTRVRSPLAGRVQDVRVQRGERVDAGAPLVEVVGTDTLDMIVQVPASTLSRLRVGLPAEVIQDGDSTPAAGSVAALAPAVDSLTNAGKAVIRIPNPGGRLRPGAGGTARIRLGTRRDVLVAPDDALVLVGDSTTVFVVGRDSVAHQRSVARGLRAAGRSEVAGDVRAGDRVVTTGAFGLQDGMRVVPAGQ